MDNQTTLILVALGGALAAAVAGGAVLSLIAVGVGRFLNRNAPSDAAMAAFESQRLAKTAQAGPRERKSLSPNWEPLIISVAGFAVIYILAALFVRVPPPNTGTVAQEAKPAAPAALPSKGDLTAVVSELPAGDADSGVKLFTSIGCSACHGLQKDQRLVGPSFYGLWGRAGSSVPNLGAREYLYQSITLPNEHVVDTYQPNLMPQNYTVVLNAQQIADLLAYIERDHNEK
jgi:cytochrome c2